MRDTGKSIAIPSTLADKLLSTEFPALLTLHVSTNSFSHFSTYISLQGANTISGNPDNVRNFYSKIPGSQTLGNGYYIFPCNTILPEIVFYFGGVAFPITKSFNRGVPYQGSPNCLGSIVADEVTNQWTMGTAFMTNVYTVFDVGNRRVGLATLA
jgi:cathepsin D